jgi:GH24 family phage-related lysozyme (muramidase)
MVSLAFNIGSRAFLGSTALRRVNEGKFHEAGEAFLMWDKGHRPKGFVVIPGLLK